MSRAGLALVVPPLLGAVLALTGCTSGATAGHPVSAPHPKPSGPSTLTETEARDVISTWDTGAPYEFGTGTAPQTLEGAPLAAQLDAVTRQGQYGGAPVSTYSLGSGTIRVWIPVRQQAADADWVVAIGRQDASTYVGGATSPAAERISLLHGHSPTDQFHLDLTALALGSEQLDEVTPVAGRVGTWQGQPHLVDQPGAVCGHFVDYLNDRGGAGQPAWDARTRQLRTDVEDQRAQDGPRAAQASLYPGFAAPALRTADGGALVFCEAVDSSHQSAKPGYDLTLKYSGWAGTTGVKWASFDTRTVYMLVFDVPASGAVRLLAQEIQPLSFQGVRATG